MTRDERQSALVRDYAAAKSRQDVEAALAECHPDFAIETIPFATASRDRAETARHLGLFFSVFPDYRAETEGLASGADGVGWWGRIGVTFRGPLLGLAPTGRRAELPAFSAFVFRDGLLLRERFFFDLPALCEGVGLRLDALQRALAPLRAPVT